MKSRIERALAPHIASSLDEIGTTATTSAAQWEVLAIGDTQRGAMGVDAFTTRRPVTDDTLFDIASVSKLFTATAATIAVDEGRIAFDAPIDRWLDSLSNQPHPAPTLAQLLNHSSGLPAWDTYYERYPMKPSSDTRRMVLDEILASDRVAPGTRSAYSDLGYILLGRLIERLFDSPLEDVVRGRILEPLEMEHTRYVRLLRGDTPIDDAVATEDDPRRTCPVIGVVHDENCYIQGGVEGHAGLFSTAADLVRFGRHMLDVHRGKPGILESETLRKVWRRDNLGPGGHHVLGWDTPSGAKTSVGRGFSRTATYGHLGFTGTSLWLDHSRDVVAALLTNRVYPTRENPKILGMRIDFHEAVIPPEG